MTNLNSGLCDKSLKMKGLDIWYGRFAVQTSNFGKVVRKASPSMTSRLLYPMETHRFLTSPTIRLSISMAITFLASGTRRTVRFPVPKIPSAEFHQSYLDQSPEPCLML